MKSTTIILLMVMILSIQGVNFAENSTAPEFSGGSGTQEDPYLIDNAEDLIAFSEKYGPFLKNHEGYYKLTSDIDLENHTWMPIGDDWEPFRGKVDGNGKTIHMNTLGISKYNGIFGKIDVQGLVKNLTVQSDISITVETDIDFYLGLIAGYSEGTVENCITKGILTVKLDSPSEVGIGGIIGKGSGSLLNVLNETSLNVIMTGEGVGAVGGIVGNGYSSPKSLQQATNRGMIQVESESKADIGGIAGSYTFGGSVENVYNEADVILINSSFGGHLMVNAGGIVGELWQADLSKAINIGNITTHYISTDFNVLPRAGGVAGAAGYATMTNVGNEGNITVKGDKIVTAAGITGGGGPSLTIQNAYNKGAIFGSTIQQIEAELYVAGMMEGEARVDNFYNSGSVRIKVGTLRETDVEALKNVRPGEDTKIYNYCYWSSELLPFPLLIKPEPTNSSFNRVNGDLSKEIAIGTARYSKLSSALNGWVSSKKSAYSQWSEQVVPTFEEQFGYKEIIYKNQVEGKWLNASDWAVPWLIQANQKEMIPAILANQDMTLPINRKEFSALAVALYEHINGPVELDHGINPFIDTNDIEVLKAYSLGIVSGVGNDLFSPETNLTREQASVMMTRVYKALNWEGWTLDLDAAYTDFKLDIDGTESFADDEQISGWAKESVYFMVKKGVINGVGNDLFDAQGGATREQAVKIAIAMLESLY